MAIQDDFTIDYVNRTIKHTSGTTVYSVNALYSWLQDTFDELAQMDDPVPMSAQTPTDYSLINGWFMDNASTKFLSGGAIQTIGYTDEIQEIFFATDAGAVAGDIGKRVTDDSVEVGTLIHYSTDGLEWYVRKDAAGTIASGSVVAVVGGTGAGTTNADGITGEELWANAYTIGAIEAGSNVYVVQDGVKLTQWWAANSGHIDALFRVKHLGTEVNDGKITCFIREWGDTYDHLEVDLSGGGRTPVPLATQDDPNNDSSEATVEDYGDGTTYTMTISYSGAPYSKDLNNGSGAKNYDAVIDADGARVSEVYEWLKYITQEGATTPLATDPGTDGEQYLRANATYTVEKRSPLGTFAGGKLFLARGIWIENYHSDDVQAFQLIASDGTTQVPPNLVTVKVTSVVSGDRVSVFPLVSAGGDIEKDTYTGAASGNDSGDGDFVVQEAISSDTPQAGYLRIVTADGSEALHLYSSWSGSTFTLSGSTLGATYDDTATVYVPIIDKEATTTEVSNTLIQSTDIPVLIRVRKKGILPFEVEGTVTSTGLTVAAIRTIDTVVT
jgi:hypothetical protein